mgnify:CR=1 FL=1
MSRSEGGSASFGRRETQQLEVDTKRLAEDRNFTEAGRLQELLTHMIEFNPDKHIAPSTLQIENSRKLAAGEKLLEEEFDRVVELKDYNVASIVQGQLEKLRAEIAVANVVCAVSTVVPSPLQIETSRQLAVDERRLGEGLESLVAVRAFNAAAIVEAQLVIVRAQKVVANVPPADSRVNDPTLDDTSNSIASLLQPLNVSMLNADVSLQMCA